MKKPDLLSCSMMALVGAMWGFHGPAIKFAFAAGFTLPQLVLGEYVIGALVFGCAVAVQGRGAPARGSFWAILSLAGVVGCGVPLFLFWAYQLGPVSIGATLLFLYVPFTQLLNLAITRRRPAPRELASAALIVVGAALAADFVHRADAASLRGAPLAVLAALCFAAFFSLTARLGQTGTPALRSLVCCLLSGAVVAVVAAAARWSLIPDVHPLARAAVWVVALGVLGQVVPVFLLVHFGPRTGSGLGSILASTELPVAVATSALVLGERIGPAQIVGVGLVLAGIALPHLPARARPSSAPSA
jgi:drug/metabolite transporter (DMT)-like permease